MKKKKKQNKKWMRLRHRIVRNVACAIMKPYSYLKYGVRVERFREQGDRSYLVLYNHQTAFDQFFVGMAFRGPIYYLASEDLFSKGWVSSIIRYLVAPIPIKKQTTDIKAILNCIRVAKEGGTIAIAPEGNRTYSGKTEYMSPTIAPLARKLGLPIALYHLEGGYGVHPRWSDVVRKGKMRGYVHHVIEPEEYANMTDDELFAAIRDGLAINEAVADAEFHHKKLAEYLERAIYVCPHHGLSTFESHGDIIECKQCGKKVRYLPSKELAGVDHESPFRFINDWYDYQSDYMNGLDLLQYTESPLYTEKTSIANVIPYKKKDVLDQNAEISLYGDRITVKMAKETLVFPFAETLAVTLLGKNKLNIYHGDKIYQLKSDKRFNALKYVHFYHRHKNIIEGDTYGKFLGL